MKKPRKTPYRLPCPMPPKGVPCHLCGARYVCAQPERKKPATKEQQP